jgi:hypothetical protein
MNNNNDRWSALSMKDRAALIDIYVKSGITDLGEIRKDYNSFGPGGPIETDEYGYPADINPAVVVGQHPKTMEFFEDFANRYNGFNNTDATNTVLKTVKEDNPVVKTTGYNMYNPITDKIYLRTQGPITYTHELTHKLNDSFPRRIKRTKEELQILKDAYPLGNKGAHGKLYEKLISDREYFTTNTELRRRISKLYGDVLGEELNSVINSMSDDELAKIAGLSGYSGTNDFYKYKDSIKTGKDLYEALKEGKEGEKAYEDLSENLKAFYQHSYESGNAKRSNAGEPNSELLDKVREALIRVAQNNTNENRLDYINPDNIAAFGGKLNSFGDGGDTEPLYYDDTYIEPAVVTGYKTPPIIKTLGDYSTYNFINSMIEKNDERYKNNDSKSKSIATKLIPVIIGNSLFNSFGDGGRILDGTEEEQTLSGKKPNIFNKLIKQYLFGDISDDEVKRRLYHNVEPHNYKFYDGESSVKRIKDAVKKNESEYDKLMEGYNSFSSSRDDIYAEYLQIPKSERHTIEGKTIVSDARYSPTKGTSENLKKINLGEEDITNLVDSGLQLKHGKNKVDTPLSYYFADHTVGRGFDNKGDYVSYYDLWDLNPYKGKYAHLIGTSNLVPKKIKEIEDLSLGIGNPTEYYDRVYLDDYFDIPEEARGAPFITPAVVTAKKTNGGKLNKFETGGPVGEGTATYNHPRYNHKEESAIYSYLRERGVPHTQAAAIMGNIAVESMLDPHISQIGGGGGYGLIQATDQPRKNNFINYDGQIYEFGSELDPETQRQLDYIIDKGLNDYTIGEWRKVGKSGARNVRKEFLKESDITKASDLFTKGYLRPGKPHTKRRQSMSRYFNDNYGKAERQLKSFADTFLFK